ncbi:hypothetical protein AVEN_113273-1 [Araneus ventricosus]|uniref:Uncharacterized protein n=1 Tax=Araneus ventricosus TaxID=182803 RepID=A0A4Y2TED5_ARAVE|nr:hypothetical protein AVEN_17850-1 [Araneus ventricosus]GBN97445.1 hypothetical protein AVEN_113273-1 [Araneus ventricosus]
MFPCSLVRRSLFEVRFISSRGTLKNSCSFRVCGVYRTFRRNVSKCLDIKGSDLTDNDLSIVPMDCCRFCMRLEECAAGRVPTGNKFPKTDVERRTTDHGNRILEVL